MLKIQPVPCPHNRPAYLKTGILTNFIWFCNVLTKLKGVGDGIMLYNKTGSDARNTTGYGSRAAVFQNPRD